MLRKILKNIIDSLISFECYFIKSEKHSKKRVLILRKDTLGDYILFYPTLSVYRNFFKDAEITLVISKLFESLSPLLKDFENVVWYDAKKFSSNFLYRRMFLIDLKKKGFDVAIQPTFSRESAGDFMMKLTKASEIIGVDGDCTASTEREKNKNNNIYTKIITVPEEIITELDKNIYIVEQITGQKIDIKFPTIDISIFSNTKEEEIIKNNKLTKKSYVVVVPGSGTTFKIWPTEKFSEVIDFIVSRGFVPVLCGSKGEKKLVNNIIIKMKNKEKVVNISGGTDLPTVAHLIKDSAFYFGSDTGITHLAAAIEVPVVCVIGGGHFRRFFPYGNLEKNRIVFDENMKCKNDNWACSKNLKSWESSPCVKNIKIENVNKEIDVIINSL